MKPRLIAAVLTVLVALVGAGVWLLFVRQRPYADQVVTPSTSIQGPQGEREPVEPLRPVQVSDPGAGLAGEETTVAWPVDLELELVSSARLLTASGAPPQGSGRTARLNGRVMVSEGIGVPATVTFEAGLNAGRVLQANSDGWFGATDLYPGMGVVRVAGPGIPGSMREVRLSQGQEARLMLSYGAPGALGGVVFGAGDQPLEDVDVELDGQRTSTNAEGKFIFGDDRHIPGGTDVVLLLRKEGYAPVHARIGVSALRTLPADHYRFRMERGASLEVVLPTAAGASGPATVILTPATLQTEPRYAWWLLGPYEIQPGTSLRLHDLPPTRVSVRVYHRGARAVPPQAIAILRPDHLERVEIGLEPAPRLTGRVLDERGRAVPGAEVVLEAPDRVRAGAAQLSDVTGGSVYDAEIQPALPPSVQRVKADSDGLFALTAWEDVAPTRYLTATSPDGRLRGGRAVHAGESEIELRLEPAEQGRARLEVEFPGRFQGLPVRVSVGGELRPEAILSPSQPLTLEGLTPGRWRISARWNGELLFPGDGSRQVDIGDGTRIEVPLPSGAIQGQDEDILERAGRKP